MSKKNPTMPEIGSRQHRILVELARHTGTVPENILMAKHGLDGLSETVWRQGPYKALAHSGLISQYTSGWALTQSGRRLMDSVEDSMIRAAGGESEAKPNLATPRTAPPFKQLTRQNMRLPIREGAFDYRDIPSLHNRPTEEK